MLRLGRLALVLAAACATAGPADYHPLHGTEGYSEGAIVPHRYDVHYAGSASTAPARAQELALRRAAELTTRDGLQGFYVMASGIHLRNPNFVGPKQCLKGTPPVSFVCSGGPSDTGAKAPFAEMIIVMLTPAEMEACRQRGIEVRVARAILDDKADTVFHGGSPVGTTACP
jgi:hypothetical protein